jgi:hypothetical protein
MRPRMDFVHRGPGGRYDFRINDRGFRNDRNITYDRPQNVVRILSLGDSHTLGFEVNQDQTYSYICEQLLIDQGLDAEVINAGLSGFGTSEEMVMLENEGIKYQPDYVVLGFFANDFEDNIRSGLYRLLDDSLVVGRRIYIPGVQIQNKIYAWWVFRFLGENSYLYSLAFNTVWDYFKERSAESGRKGVAQESAIPTEQVGEYEHRLALKLLQRIKSFCSDQGIKLVILDIPAWSIKERALGPSIPDPLLTQVRANCDTLFSTRDMLQELKLMRYAHVPYGQRHISPETHAMLGEKIARYVLAGRDLR